jgi:hypothetical protein
MAYVHENIISLTLNLFVLFESLAVNPKLIAPNTFRTDFRCFAFVIDITWYGMWTWWSQHLTSATIRENTTEVNLLIECLMLRYPNMTVISFLSKGLG